MKWCTSHIISYDLKHSPSSQPHPLWSQVWRRPGQRGRGWCWSWRDWWGCCCCCWSTTQPCLNYTCKEIMSDKIILLPTWYWRRDWEFEADQGLVFHLLETLKIFWMYDVRFQICLDLSPSGRWVRNSSNPSLRKSSTGFASNRTSSFLGDSSNDGAKFFATFTWNKQMNVKTRDKLLQKWELLIISLSAFSGDSKLLSVIYGERKSTRVCPVRHCWPISCC